MNLKWLDYGVLETILGCKGGSCSGGLLTQVSL